MKNKYIPQPLDTSDVIIPDSLTDVIEALAENVHDVWSQGRINDGWSYGPTRDDEKKHHPCLVAYDELSDEEKNYDRNTSQETIKFILKSGYSIVKNEKEVEDGK